MTRFILSLWGTLFIIYSCTCIVRIDPTLFTAYQYINMINVYKTPNVKTIYNIINVQLSEYNWYTKLLSPQIYPQTCVFNSTAQLIDLVPGNSKESLSYIGKAINTRKPCPEFKEAFYNDFEKANPTAIKTKSSVSTFSLSSDEFLRRVNNLTKIQVEFINRIVDECGSSTSEFDFYNRLIAINKDIYKTVPQNERNRNKS